MNLNNKRINEAKSALLDAQLSLNTVVHNEQLLCRHVNQAECEYAGETIFMYAQAPLRICLDCGITDEGWGGGYKVLKNRLVYKMDRKDLLSLRVGKRYEQNRS